MFASQPRLHKLIKNEPDAKAILPEPRSVKNANSYQIGSLQMKPRTFGEIFGRAALLLGGGSFVLGWIAHDQASERGRPIIGMGGLFFISLVAGIVGGFLVAKHYQGEIIVKECDDPKKVLDALAVRLAGNRYSRETQTEFLHTFTPFLRSPILRVSILQEGLTLRIVGPKCVLEKLRDV